MTEYYSYYYNHNRRTATTNCFYSYVDADDSDDDNGEDNGCLHGHPDNHHDR